MLSTPNFSTEDFTVIINNLDDTFTLRADGRSWITQIGDWDLSAADIATVLVNIPSLPDTTARWWVLNPDPAEGNATLQLLSAYPFTEAPTVVELFIEADQGYFEVNVQDKPNPVRKEELYNDSWLPSEYLSDVEDAGYTVTSPWIVQPVLDQDGQHRVLRCVAIASPMNAEEWVPIWTEVQ
ncbi:hypothetical protein [Corynebacterium sp.]|uniref:hypothetical protein n=1 Tax=Corynebacterium sp. TaxID=1720 RepID=UPI0026DC5C99|nr:hypothetical protein [Corynebacterium sp.]MDO5077385.1 hypothetical protein [Corynebacterium sp.]